MKDYCTQNNGDCSTCSLVNYRRDCMNNPIQEAEEVEAEEELLRRSEAIKAKLAPWRGMTLTEARDHGWGEEQDRLQAELWRLGLMVTKSRRKGGL